MRRFPGLRVSVLLLLFLSFPHPTLAANIRQQSVLAGPFSLGSVWSGALGPTAAVDTVSVNQKAETAGASLTLLSGDTVNFSYVPDAPLAHLTGGLLPQQTLNGAWIASLANRNNCNASPFTYTIGSVQYSFVSCGTKPAFALSSSNPSVISCSGTTCTAVAQGTATITAQIAGTPVKLWGNQSGNAVWSELVSTTLPTATLTWDVNVVLPPTINFTTASSLVPYNSGTTLTWSSTNATSCTSSGGTNGWSGAKPVSGSFATGNLTSIQNYTLTCSNAAASVSRTVTVNVDAPNPAPTITLGAGSAQVASGTATTLTWSSGNASTCIASSSPSAGSWSGAKPLSGTESTGPITMDTDFILTCSGLGGSTSRLVTVRVAIPPATPSIDYFYADPNGIPYGGSTTLSWGTTDASSCSASAVPAFSGWTGLKTTAGTKALTNLTTTTTFTLTCSNSGGSVSNDITVPVAPQGLKPPTLTFWSDSVSLPYNGETTLHWSSVGADACWVHDGRWGWQDVDFSGSLDTGLLTSSTDFTFDCANLAGETDMTITILVAEPTLPVTLDVQVSQYVVPYGVSMPDLWQWQSTNATSCLEVDYDLSGNELWRGWLGFSGSAEETLTEDVVFVIRCENSTNAVTKTFTITIDPTTIPAPEPMPEPEPVPTAPEPTITFQSELSFVVFNTSTVLTWSSTDATSCLGYWGANGWAGAKPLSGSLQTGNLRGDTTFGIECTGPGGEAWAEISIRVGDPSLTAPTLNFWADSFAVNSGSATTLRWNSQNATSCRAFGDWTGSKPLSGSANTGAITAAKTYKLRCSSPAGNIMFQVTILVGTSNPSPTLNFWVDDPVLPEDLSRTTTTLRWNSQNATSCTASGAADWSGAVALGGSKGITVPVPTTYKIECQGPGGMIDTTVSVGIGNTNGSGPQVTLRADSYTVAYGTKPKLYIQAQDVGTCFADWLGGSPLTVTNGALPASLFVPISAPATYQVTCQDSGGLGLSATAMLTINTAQFFICPSDALLVVGWAPVQFNAWYVENALEAPDCDKVSDPSYVAATIAAGGRVDNVSADVKTTWGSIAGTGAATVDSAGLVTAVDEGSATLTASFEGPGGTLSVNRAIDIFLPPIVCHRCDTTNYTCSMEAYFGLSSCPAHEYDTAAGCTAVCRDPQLNMIEVGQ